jgi:glutathione S-transferase
VQKVMWALAECGIDHERIDAGGRHGRTDTAEFAAMNPARRVPVWQETGLTLWETHAILRHLGRGPAAALWPGAPAARALADQWMEFTTSTLQPPFVGVFWQAVRLPPADRSEAAKLHHLAALTDALAIVEARLEHAEWLAGPAFGLADIAAGAMMYRYFDIDLPRPDMPALARWYRALAARPAYRATVMTSYDELRG